MGHFANQHFLHKWTSEWSSRAENRTIRLIIAFRVFFVYINSLDFTYKNQFSQISSQYLDSQDLHTWIPKTWILKNLILENPSAIHPSNPIIENPTIPRLCSGGWKSKASEPFFRGGRFGLYGAILPGWLLLL